MAYPHFLFYFNSFDRQTSLMKANRPELFIYRSVKMDTQLHVIYIIMRRVLIHHVRHRVPNVSQDMLATLELEVNVYQGHIRTDFKVFCHFNFNRRAWIIPHFVLKFMSGMSSKKKDMF